MTGVGPALGFSTGCRRGRSTSATPTAHARHATDVTKYCQSGFTKTDTRSLTSYGGDGHMERGRVVAEFGGFFFSVERKEKKNVRIFFINLSTALSCLMMLQ